VSDGSGGEAEQPTWLAGNVGGAWRIGGMVHRATGPWTAAVHALLEFLASRLTEYQVHYNMARPHQGIAQRVPTTSAAQAAPPQPTSVANRYAENPSWAA
jgi:hypothetical protein